MHKTETETGAAPRPSRFVVLGPTVGLDGAPIRAAYGAFGRFDQRLGPRWGLSVSFAGDRSSAQHPLGTAFAARLAVGVDATLGLYREDFALQAAAGVSVGLVRMRGEPLAGSDVGGDSFAAPLLAPRIAGRFHAWPWGRVFLSAGIEVAVVVSGAHGYVDELRLVSVRGATLHGQLGLGVAL